MEILGIDVGGTGIKSNVVNLETGEMAGKISSLTLVMGFKQITESELKIQAPGKDAGCRNTEQH